MAIAVCMSVHSLRAVGSVPDPGYCAEVIGCRARKAEKLEIGGDLLEQHVGADLDRASECARGLRNGVNSSFMTTSPTKAEGSIRATSTGSGSPAFMPTGVALTTIS